MTEKKTGFFTRTDAAAAIDSHRSVSGVSDETLWQLGLRGVKKMNPRAKSPMMEPRGSDSPVIYFLGEQPSAEDDESGKPFSGAQGVALRNATPKRIFTDVRLNNVVRTRTQKAGFPSHVEVECFRPSLIKDIEETKPAVIVALGITAARWCLRDLQKKVELKVLRGRRFVAKIGSHTCYVVPTWHPSIISKLVETQEKLGRAPRHDGVDADEVIRWFGLDIALAADCASLPAPETFECSTKTLAGIVKHTTTIQGVRDACAWLLEQPVISGDIETNALRPYRQGKLLSIALGTAERVYAIPLDHPGARWTKRERDEIDALLQKVLRDHPCKIIQNLAFELEWFASTWGSSVLQWRGWQDTMLQAFVLDERQYGHSLDFLAQLHVGVAMKSLSKVDVKALEQAPVSEVLSYNGIDVVFTFLVYEKQAQLIKEQKLSGIYKRQVRRIPAMVGMQARGITIDQGEVDLQLKDVESQMHDIVVSCRKLKVVKKYELEFERFSPSSNAALLTIFRDYLNRPEVRSGDGFSTDADALEKMSDEPLAALVLEYRSLQKLHGTYLSRFSVESPKTLVYPDGKIHCVFNTTFAVSGRLSSEDPNNQNWPKRKNKQVRKIVVGGKGKKIIAADYGQIEARVLAMESRDAVFVKALWEDYDVHMEWATKIAAVAPDSFELHGDGNMKLFRSVVKNKWVFPLFYGSSKRSVSASLSLEDYVANDLFDEFWETFVQVKTWQEKKWSGYMRDGFVQGLTGRRKRGPLTFNQAINIPVQGAAADITVDAAERLAELSFEEADFLHPVINVHDDLTFVVPDSEVDWALGIIVEEMLSFKAPWVNVPLAVEVEIGDNWYEMHEAGKYSSTELT